MKSAAATIVALLIAPSALLVAQAPAVSGKVVSCIDPNTRALISCDSPSPAAAAPGLNPTVAAAANSLGQALGQALIRSLFSRPSSTTATAPRPDSAAIARALERARVARTKEELMNALGISPGDASGLTMTGDAPAELHMAADPAPGQLQLVGAPPRAPGAGPGPTVEDTTPTVGTLDLHVGDASLLSPAMSMG